MNTYILRLFVAQGGMCFHCGTTMKKRAALNSKRSGRRNDGYTREHLVPKSKGGGNGENVVLAHKSCNLKKGEQMPTANEVSRAKRIHEQAKSLPVSALLNFHVTPSNVGDKRRR